MPKPKLIAFDLDYTLWPFWVDTHVDPPFRKEGGKIIDSHGAKIKAYPEVTQALKQLHSEGYIVAAASRTGEIQGARQLVKLLDWEQYFTYKEIYPGCKINHFKKFKEYTGLEYSEMLFFDDEHRNKVDLEKIGVLTIMVDDGVNINLIKDGLEEYDRKYRSK